MAQKCFFGLVMCTALLSVTMVARLNALPSHLKYVVVEEVAVGSEVGFVTKDLLIEGPHHFKFLAPLPSFLVFNASTSRLSTAARIDREEICNTGNEEDDLVEVLMDKKTREGEMERDGGCKLERALVVQQQGRSEVISISIHIQDINDHQPTFFPNNVHLSIIESTPANSTFKLPRARDLDAPASSVSSYQLETEEDSQVFALDMNKKGEVSLKLLTKLDREQRDSYRMRVIATDAGFPRHSGYLLVKVEVIDSNDNSPLFDQAFYNHSVPEDAAFMTLISQVHASDADLGANAEVVVL